MDNDLPILPDLPLGRYRHYKGGEYDVLGVVRHSESLEPLVLYRPCHRDSGDWVRPHAMFIESVTHAGTTQPRFARMDGVAPASSSALTDTVQRMEARLAESPEAAVQQLMQAYRQLAARFEQDLASSARDVQLAKASALMLVQAIHRKDDVP